MTIVLFSSKHGWDNQKKAAMPFTLAIRATEAGNQAWIVLTGEAAALPRQVSCAPADEGNFLRALISSATQRGIPIYLLDCCPLQGLAPGGGGANEALGIGVRSINRQEYEDLVLQANRMVSL